MHRSLTTLALACALAWPLAAIAQSAAVVSAPAASSEVRMHSAEIEVRAKVIQLDTEHRIATLRGPRGRVFVVDVPPEVQNFDQVRVGDELILRYLVAVAARLEPAPKNGIRERVESGSAERAEVGFMPGAAGRRMIEVVAEIQAVDRKQRTVTLRGAKRSLTLGVPPDIDMAKLKAGQNVRAMVVEAAALSMEPATPAN